MKMTSAYANKVIRKLKEDKLFWRNKEAEGSTYVCALDEEPVIPEYDYKAVTANIQYIDRQIVTIKHAINLANITNLLDINGEQLSVDSVLVRMAQLSERKAVLDRMRKQEPKTRLATTIYSARKNLPEYQYINYDLELVKKEYEEIDAELAAMQMALDKYNQTVEFEVDIEG